MTMGFVVDLKLSRWSHNSSSMMCRNLEEGRPKIGMSHSYYYKMRELGSTDPSHPGEKGRPFFSYGSPKLTSLGIITAILKIESPLISFIFLDNTR